MKLVGHNTLLLCRNQRLHRLNDGSKASNDGMTAMDMASHGSGLLLVSGHKSGILRLWECKMKISADGRKLYAPGSADRRFPLTKYSR